MNLRLCRIISLNESSPISAPEGREDSHKVLLRLTWFSPATASNESICIHTPVCSDHGRQRTRLGGPDPSVQPARFHAAEPGPAADDTSDAPTLSNAAWSASAGTHTARLTSSSDAVLAKRQTQYCVSGICLHELHTPYCRYPYPHPRPHSHPPLISMVGVAHTQRNGFLSGRAMVGEFDVKCCSCSS